MKTSVISTTLSLLLYILLCTSVLAALGRNKKEVSPEEAIKLKNQEELLDPSKRRNGRKKKKVEGRVYASYGLNTDKSTPNRVIDYSAAAVSAASTVAKKPAARKKPLRKKVASAAAAAASSSSSSSLKGRGGRSQLEKAAPGTQAKVDLRPYMSAVEDQADSNSCAANAVAGAYEYLATRAAIRDGETDVGDISRLFIYYVGRKRDQINWGEDPQIKPKDEGMSLGGAIEAVQLKGAALQSSWPFNLTNINIRPTEEAFEEAIRFKVGDAMNVPLDLHRMRQCLSDGYPIIFGLKLTKGFFSPPRDGFMPTPDPTDPESAEHGLHAMLIVGYNDRQRIFIVRNSWGKDWGVDGYIYLSYDYVVNEAFNFLGMYAIQSLTDDDLTPDDDDGDDAEQIESNPHDDSIFVEPDVEDHEDDEEDDEEDDFDADDMFDTIAEARRAFREFSGEDLRLSKAELRNALLRMGVPMLTDEEVEWAFRRYDDDHSGYISFEQFLNMHSLFDGSLLWRRKKLKKLMRMIDRWRQNAIELLRNKGKGYDGNEKNSTTDYLDIHNMFSTIDYAYLAFVDFSGEDLGMSRTELNSTLLQMGVSMVTDEEIEMAFRRYDHDQSEYISFDEFLDMRSLLDGILLEQHRKLKEVISVMNDWEWLQNTTERFSRRSESEIKDSEPVKNIDMNDIFGSIDNAHQTFEKIAGEDLHLSKVELHDTLFQMGVPMLTDEEIEMAFQRYDHDCSGYISFDEFLDMRSLLDGSLLQRRRKLKKMISDVKKSPWIQNLKNTPEFFRKRKSDIAAATKDVFGNIEEAHRAFEKYASEGLSLSEAGLRDALFHMGMSAISNEMINDTFQQFEDVTLEKFLSIITMYNGSLLWCRRTLRKLMSNVNEWSQSEAAQKIKQYLKRLSSVVNDWISSGAIRKVGIQLQYKNDYQGKKLGDDIFGTLDEAHNAFEKFGGEDASLSSGGLRDALVYMGAPKVTDEDIKRAFQRYDADHLGIITFDQYIDTILQYDFLVLWYQRKLNDLTSVLKDSITKGVIRKSGIKLTYN